jgi:hypothetical protein
MANKRKGQTVSSTDWARHLRPIGRRLFWGKQRAADKVLCETGDDFASALPKKKSQKPFGIEYRWRWNEKWGPLPSGIINHGFGAWKPYRWFVTKGQRDRTLEGLRAIHQETRMRIEEYRLVNR